MSDDVIDVVVVHHPPGIMAGCKHCRTIHAQGQFALGVSIDGSHYIIGHNPPVRCCNEEKRVPLLFDTEDAALGGSKAIVETIVRDGIEGVRLLPRSLFMNQ